MKELKKALEIALKMANEILAPSNKTLDQNSIDFTPLKVKEKIWQLQGFLTTLVNVYGEKN